MKTINVPTQSVHTYIFIFSKVSFHLIRKQWVFSACKKNSITHRIVILLPTVSTELQLSPIIQVTSDSSKSALHEFRNGFGLIIRSVRPCGARFVILSVTAAKNPLMSCGNLECIVFFFWSLNLNR